MAISSKLLNSLQTNLAGFGGGTPSGVKVSTINNLQGMLADLMASGANAQLASMSPGTAAKELGPQHPINIVLNQTKSVAGGGGDIGSVLKETLERLAKVQVFGKALAGDRGSLDFFQREHEERQKEQERAAQEERDKKAEEAAKARSKEKWAAFRGIGSSFQGFMGTGNEAKSGEAASAAVGQLGTFIGGGIGKVLGPLGAFGEALFKSVNTIGSWAETLRESDFRFAELSGAMAEVAFKTRQAEMQIGIERGDRRSESAGRREEAYIELQRAWAPLGDALANAKNDMLAKLMEVLTSILETIEEGLALLGIEIPRVVPPLTGTTAGSYFAEEGRRAWEEWGRPDWGR